jgi:DNA-binding transcriptional MerR regulator
MADPIFISRKEAAALCHRSEDTLRRYDRAGRLPNRRVGDDGAVHYAVADLVAIGLLDPLAADGPLAEVASHSRAERELAVARTELAVAEARIEELLARVERADEEVAFLRRLLVGRAVA